LKLNFLKKIIGLLQRQKGKEKREEIKVRVVESAEKEKSSESSSAKSDNLSKKPSVQITVSRITIRERSIRIRRRPPRIPSSRKIGLKPKSHFEKKHWSNKDPIEED